jgi:hypothetical protein
MTEDEHQDTAAVIEHAKATVSELTTGGHRVDTGARRAVVILGGAVLVLAVLLALQGAERSELRDDVHDLRDEAAELRAEDACVSARGGELLAELAESSSVFGRAVLDSIASDDPSERDRAIANYETSLDELERAITERRAAEAECAAS